MSNKHLPRTNTNAKSLLLLLLPIVFMFLSVETNAQTPTINGTGTSADVCGTCAPDFWFTTGGTPDISNQNIAGGGNTLGAGASWVNAAGTIAPLPQPNGDARWITMRDVGDYNNQDPALTANNLKCYDENCMVNKVLPLSASFTNCIFTGNDQDEISLFDATDGSDPSFFNYSFKNCIVTVDELIDPEQFPNFFNNCENCLNVTRNDTLFLNLDENIYSLDTMSVALGQALPIQFVTDDILGVMRDQNTPDIGCYEFE